MSLTVYIPRLITDEQLYDMFINCVERVNKYIKGFDNMQIIVLCDNETKLTKIGDQVLQKEYNNISFVDNPLKTIPDFAGYYHFMLCHPSEYMVNVFANMFCSRDIDKSTVINSINKFGCYSFCYNYCNTNMFTKIYRWMKVLFPEITFLDDYLNVKTMRSDHVSAQGNQMFTSYDALCKVKEHYPTIFDKLMNYNKLTYNDFANTGLFSEKKFNRQIRTVIEHFFTQLFFRTYSYPSNRIPLIGQSESCLFGLMYPNRCLFGYILTDRMRYIPLLSDYKLYTHCNDPRLHDCYNKLYNPEF